MQKPELAGWPCVWEGTVGSGSSGREAAEAAEAELHGCASSGSKLLVDHLLELGWVPGAGLCIHRRPADHFGSASLRS